MKKPFDLRTFTFSGSYRQIGQQHGEALRGDIRRTIDHELDNLEKTGQTPEAFYEMFYGENRFMQTAEQWTPGPLEMVRGIAQGAGVDFRALFIYSLVDENSWYFLQKRGGLSQLESNRCSALGAFGSRAKRTLIAQNADMGKAVDGTGLLLRLKNTESGVESLTITLPGLIGVYGMNHFGIGVCLNTLWLHMNKSTTGLGTLFVAQGILERTSFEEADRFVRSVPHATGEAYTVGSPGMAAAYEGSANRVEGYIPFEGAEEVYHTNHPLVNTDVELTPVLMNSLSPELQGRIGRAEANTRERLQSVHNRMRQAAFPLTVEKAIDILSTHDDPDNPVCRHKREESDAMTNFCMVMELDEDPTLTLSAGPPCMSEFRTFRFSGENL